MCFLTIKIALSLEWVGISEQKKRMPLKTKKWVGIRSRMAALLEKNHGIFYSTGISNPIWIYFLFVFLWGISFFQNKKYIVYIIAKMGLFYLAERAEMLIFAGFVPCLVLEKVCLRKQRH